MNINRRRKMINICRLKIDKKGRITLPRTLLDANGIESGGYVVIRAMQTSNSVKLLFEGKNSKSWSEFKSKNKKENKNESN